MSPKLLPALVALIAAAVGIWLLSREAPQPSATPPTPVATSTAAETATAAAATTPSPSHRLAGTVVGDVQYAIIEAPDGGNELYHLGETVPGLGALVAIRAKSVTFSGSRGEYEMKLIAATTSTPYPVGTAPSDAGDDPDGERDDLFDDERYDDLGYDDRDEDAYIDERR